MLDGYRCFRRAFQDASNPMNPEHPDLGACATGDALQTVTSRFLARRQAGEIFKGAIELTPEVKEVVADRAVVSDCIFDRMGVYDAANPDVLKEQMDTERVLERITLLKVDDRWKVATIEEEAKGCEPEDS